MRIVIRDNNHTTTNLKKDSGHFEYIKLSGEQGCHVASNDEERKTRKDNRKIRNSQNR